MNEEFLPRRTRSYTEFWDENLIFLHVTPRHALHASTPWLILFCHAYIKCSAANSLTTLRILSVTLSLLSCPPYQGRTRRKPMVFSNPYGALPFLHAERMSSAESYQLPPRIIRYERDKT